MTFITDLARMPANLRPARISPVPSRFRNTVHSYAAVQAWSRDQNALLYLGFDDFEAPGAIVIQDMASGRETVLAEARYYNGHCAAWQHWILGDTEVVFNTLDDDGVYRPYRVSRDAPGYPERIKGLDNYTFRMVTADGRYGMAHVEHWEERSANAIQVDFLTGEQTVLVESEEAVAALPGALRDPDPEQRYFFNHTVINADRTRLFFKLIHRKPRTGGAGSSFFCALMVKHLDTGRIVCLGNRISGHPVWMPDGRRIANVMSPWDRSDNRWLVFQDAVTGACERIMDGFIEGPGHPCISPDGRYLVTDAFPPDHQTSPLYLVDMPAGTLREIARLDHGFQPRAHADRKTKEPISHPRGRPLVGRGEPHPVWSPDGKQILVNCNQQAQGMQCLILSGMFAEH